MNQLLVNFIAVIKILPFLPARWVLNIIAIQEKKTYNFYVVAIFAAFVGIMRYSLEVILAHKSLLSLNVSLVQHLVFYLHCIFIYVLILHVFIRDMPWKQLVPLVLIGVFLGIFPPLIDVLIYGVGEFKYGYVTKFEQDWYWWIYNKEAKVPLGEASTLFITIFFVAVVVKLKTVSWYKSVGAAVLGYLAVFFYGGAFPLLARQTFGLMESSVSPFEHLQLQGQNLGGFSPPVQVSFFQLLLCVVIYFCLNPALFIGLLKRINHAIPVVLTCLLGYSLHSPLDVYALFIALIFFLAALMVIAQNDYFDRNEYTQQQNKLYVNKDDVAFLNIVTALLVLLLIFSGHFSGYMLLLFKLVAILYNYDMYRGKQYFPTNYKIEGIAGLSAFLGGLGMMIAIHYGLSGDALNVESFERIREVGIITPQLYAEVFTSSTAWMIFFVFGGWSILSVIKDYKDIESDRQAGYQTAYTLLLKKGKGIEKFHRIYTLALSVCMLIPVYWVCQIKAHSLFLWGLVILAVMFYLAINRAATRATVVLALSLMNVYLLVLVIAFHTSH